MSPEIEQTTDPREMKEFRLTLDRVRLTPRLQVELVTTALDTVSGYKRTFSHLYPLHDEGKLKRALASFISELVPEGENQKTLEAGFDEEPDKIVHKSRCDIVTSEWQTIHDHVVIGIKAVRDQRGERVRTWYLRNTVKGRHAKKFSFFAS